MEERRLPEKRIPLDKQYRINVFTKRKQCIFGSVVMTDIERTLSFAHLMASSRLDRAAKVEVSDLNGKPVAVLDANGGK